MNVLIMQRSPSRSYVLVMNVQESKVILVRAAVAVGIATGFGLGGQGDGIRIPVVSRPALVPSQPSIPLVTVALSLG
jgi:hypothetical protein